MGMTNKEPTTKNDLGVDAVSRDAVKYYIQAHIHEIITESGIDKNAHTNGVLRALLNGVATMPSVTPQEPILDKIFCIAHPLSIMSTPELEHKAIMQITEMLEPLCLPGGEEEE